MKKVKNSFGFTLVELMAVITILVILSLIIVPIVDKNIKRTKDDMDIIQIENIRVAGQVYYSEHDEKVPKSNNSFSFVKLSSLIDLDYISSDVLDSNIVTSSDDELYVQLFNDNGSFTYKVCPIEDDCEMYEEGIVSIGKFAKVKDLSPGVICGTGESEDYEGSSSCYINSIEDLVKFSSMVNSGYSFSGKSVYLMNNLDFSNVRSYVNPKENLFGDINGNGVEETIYDELNNLDSKGFPVIGSESNKFSGSFIGNSYVIRSLYINDSSMTNVGLFGYNSGSIKGFTLENADVHGYQNVGIIAGYNTGSVTTMIVSGNVNASNNNVGLAIGSHRGSGVLEAIVSGDVTSTNGVAGGLVGYFCATSIKGIYKSGNVISNSTNSVYGIVGNAPCGSSSAIISKDVKVKGNSISSTSLNDYNGFTAPSNMFDNIAMADTVLDTYVGGDNDGDGYYYDNNETGEISIFSMADNPLVAYTGCGASISDPCVINSYDDLKKATLNQSLHYKLNTDIDMSGKNPIIMGSYTNRFTGSFQGNGHSISNFELYGINNVGFFGDNSGTIKGLKLLNVSSNGYQNVGIISGYNTGSVTTMIVSGSVNASYNTAGLAIGSHRGSGVLEAIVSGDVTATNGVAGGLVGYFYATSVKGIYKSGSINSNLSNDVYGIMGLYSSGSSSAIISKDVKVNGNSTSSTSLSNYNGFTAPSDMFDNIAMADTVLDTFVGGDNNSDGYYYDYNQLGQIDVFSLTDNPLVAYTGCGASISDPCVINSYDDLKKASLNQSLHYMLNTDIDMSDKNPIIMSSYANKFTGSFQGNGHSISNLELYGINNVGFFGDNNGVIKGLKLLNVSSSGYQSVGIICGYNVNSVTNVMATGSVNAHSSVGLAIGNHRGNGILSQAVVSGDVTATNGSAGGLVGNYNATSINGAFISGSISSGINSDVYRKI